LYEDITSPGSCPHDNNDNDLYSSPHNSKTQGRGKLEEATQAILDNIFILVCCILVVNSKSKILNEFNI
jgi:hypothetical protein